ncbi:MAG: restriction endonuclease [Candidatus Zixiibacteriota bacterium]
MKEFLVGNLVAIGWPYIGNLVGKNREQIKQALQTFYSYSSNQSLGQAVGIINRFVNEMQIEDYVVVPDGPVVFVGYVQSDYRYDNSKDNDTDGYPHQREVEWLNEKRAIPRSVLTGRVFDSLKGQQTLFATYHQDISDIVKTQKHLFSCQNYLDLKIEYLDKLQKGILSGVNSSRFEESVRTVLNRYFPGLTRLATTNSQQGDTDLKTTLPGNLVVRIQVKHFYPEHGALDSWVVEQLANSMDEGDTGIIVTSGSISDDAKKLAEKYYREECKKISFVDGDEFVELVFSNLDSFTQDELNYLGLNKTVAFL